MEVGLKNKIKWKLAENVHVHVNYENDIAFRWCDATVNYEHCSGILFSLNF